MGFIFDFIESLSGKMVAVLLLLMFVIGVFTGIYYDISQLPSMPLQIKIATPIVKNYADSIDNQTKMLEYALRAKDGQEDKFVCLSKDREWIVVLSNNEFFGGDRKLNMNIAKRGKEIKLDDCRLLSDIEREDYNITLPLSKKLLNKL